MAEETIKAKDLTTGTAVKFYDDQWHRATVITQLKKKDAPDVLGEKKTLHVADSRGWGNYFSPDQDVTIDRTL
jgi:hypothetical protein